MGPGGRINISLRLNACETCASNFAPPSRSPESPLSSLHVSSVNYGQGGGYGLRTTNAQAGIVSRCVLYRDSPACLAGVL